MAKAVRPAIRAATLADVDEIVRVVNTAYTKAEAHFTDELRTDPAEVAVLVALGQFLVAGGVDGIAGAVHVHIDGETGHFGMLAVEPPAQGRGLGRVLVESVEALCAERGCREVHLEAVNARVELPPWYERMGYVQYGTAPYVRPPEQCKIPVHFVLMKKDLDPARG